MFAVHVDHVRLRDPFCPSRTVMQIIDVLGNQRDRPAGQARPVPLQTRQCQMRGIRHRRLHGIAAHVVETKNKLRIARERLGRGDILHPVLFPQPARIAKGADTAFCGNAGAGEDDDIAKLFHPRHETSVQWRRQVARIGIIGSNGRMGRAIALAIADANEDLAGGVGRDGNLATLAAAADVLIDFSSPAALEANLDVAIAAKVPIVIGTTGLEERHHWLIDEAATVIPVLQTGNTSLGVTLLAHLVHEAATRLGEDWDIEIVETHHRMKVDAPSGTALLLGEAAAKGRDVKLAGVSDRGRDGITGPRERGHIGFAALRGGSVAGDHSVLFLANNERLTLSHMAENRGIFARGAVRAAQWLLTRPHGRYTMPEVLGL